MENLLTSYLYGNKVCPLPTVGALVLQAGLAMALPSERKMLPPVPGILFVEREMNADGLLQYIAAKKNIDQQQASDELSSYCSRLQEMQPYESVSLGTAGSFSLNEEGQLQFKANELSQAFLPAVNAERVIHPEATHDMLVGDTQTNTTTMAGLLTTGETSRRPRWVWAAIALGIAGIIAATIYLINRQPGSFFGNTQSVNATGAPATYQSSAK
jgi:hypothetical protein